MPFTRRAVLIAMLPLPALGASQSALDPAGPDAAAVASLSKMLFIAGGVIFIVALIVLAVAIFGPPAARRALSRPALIVGAGIIFPVVVLGALLAHSLLLRAALAGDGAQAAVRIEVTGEMWWWRARYTDSRGHLMFETANDIRIPVGQPVDLVLRSDDVIHSFWVPSLAGKLDMVPGKVNRLRVQADQLGVFRGQCAEFCGAQHAQMRFHVQAMPPDEYEAWLDRQRRPAPTPADPQVLAGQQYFIQLCASCHAVRGTTASGTTGPDLTHVGSRLSLAAGVLPNNIGALAGWIAGSQHIKPGNKMPSFNIPGEQLRAVALYLESLQ